MMDESESGEAYDKIANQRQRLASKESRPRKQRDQLSPMLEAKLVRAVMSETTTVDQLARELGLKSRNVRHHLKRLGLDMLVSSQTPTRKHRTRLKRNRRPPANRMAIVRN